jgi:hypothetical protein
MAVIIMINFTLPSSKGSGKALVVEAADRN